MIKAAPYLLTLFISAFTAPAHAGDEVIWDFEGASAGDVPATWKVEATNRVGELATWAVILETKRDDETKALTITKAQGEFSSTYNICWRKKAGDAPFKDGVVEVSFKANGGGGDQGGGPMWRVRDKDNYYVARANPLEDNFRLYYVKDGKRVQLASKAVKVPADLWHRIKIIHRGDEIKGYLNGKLLLEATDSTFPGAGGIGVWTKADALTSFDDLIVRPDNRGPRN